MINRTTWFIGSFIHIFNFCSVCWSLTCKNKTCKFFPLKNLMTETVIIFSWCNLYNSMQSLSKLGFLYDYNYTPNIKEDNHSLYIENKHFCSVFFWFRSECFWQDPPESHTYLKRSFCHLLVFWSYMHVCRPYWTFGVIMNFVKLPYISMVTISTIKLS